MTADEFSMDPHYASFYKETVWDVTARDGDIKMELRVYDEDVQQIVKDNFEYFAKTVQTELTERIVSDWDNGKITDAEKAVFLEILGRLIG